MSFYLILIHIFILNLNVLVLVLYTLDILWFLLYPTFPSFKPENLMVQNVMGSACLKLIDFGDARIVYNDNYIHEYAGSAEFRAPEVIRGQAVSTLTDIWYTHVVCSFICFFIMRKNNFTLIYINYFISIVIIALNNSVKRVL